MADDEVSTPDRWVYRMAPADRYLLQGASPRELVVEACRRDQTSLIEQILNGMSEKTNEEVAEFFNSVTDPLGNYALHICASYGSCTSMITCVDRSKFFFYRAWLTGVLLQMKLWTPCSTFSTSSAIL